MCVDVAGVGVMGEDVMGAGVMGSGVVGAGVMGAGVVGPGVADGSVVRTCRDHNRSESVLRRKKGLRECCGSPLTVSRQLAHGEHPKAQSGEGSRYPASRRVKHACAVSGTFEAATKDCQRPVQSRGEIDCDGIYVPNTRGSSSAFVVLRHSKSRYLGLR